MKLTALLVPAFALSATAALLFAAPAHADTGDTGGSGESNEIQTWKSSDGGCTSVAAPATASLALLGLAFVARRRED